MMVATYGGGDHDEQNIRSILTELSFLTPLTTCKTCGHTPRDRGAQSCGMSDSSPVSFISWN